ncbi:glycosyl hydrolase family protein 43 [Striga asiatica]|uniref:Glycosyl hydrolase family protein 43 n=1 Tax=Striga asiatica TaxID=4170 RepID=A0A5A7PIX8_STRAF|nr:glycosyl hydrolase family protein 43 [Striga asiatica]
MSQHPLLSEAEVIEDESIQMPPPRRRSPRAVMRKPKPPTTLIDEFLDEYSQIRHVFFPKIETAIDTMMCAESDKFYYYPGRTWLDTEGNPIQAHGGGIVYDERSSKYYWYGEYKDGPTYQAHKNGYSREVLLFTCGV